MLVSSILVEQFKDISMFFLRCRLLPLLKTSSGLSAYMTNYLKLQEASWDFNFLIRVQSQIKKVIFGNFWSCDL